MMQYGGGVEKHALSYTARERQIGTISVKGNLAILSKLQMCTFLVLAISFLGI